MLIRAADFEALGLNLVRATHLVTGLGYTQHTLISSVLAVFSFQLVRAFSRNDERVHLVASLDESLYASISWPTIGICSHACYVVEGL